MEGFYEKWLLRIAHMHLGALCIAKHFLYPSWETINLNTIQKTNIEHEYIVPITNENNDILYTVNSEFGICSCLVGMSGALCKHQSAVLAKFHISMFNFILSLKPDNRAIYAHIALGYIAQDMFFYASLYTQPALQTQEVLYINDKVKISDNLSRTEWIEPEEPNKENKKIKEIDNSDFILFLEEIKLHVEKEVREKFINLFWDGHSLSSALHVHKDDLYLNAANEQELLEQYRDNILGSRNGKLMFKRLEAVISEYNKSEQGKAVLQEYNTNTGDVFILCIVINLMVRVYERILQSGEIYYMDASASFNSLNTSITLLYTSCMAGALPLGLFLTSDKLELTIERALNLLKTILPLNVFYSHGPQVGPMVFLTDNSNSVHNALKYCWPKALGYIAQDISFYASLHAQPALQDQEVLYINDKAKMSDNLSRTEWM
ncbi:3921_t:CDS:2 [Dentiscutata erythropus]|uniref:3921_t:CDS:1 n=1 Tax=Dentiscutata erythropus TaxID=1348616 RepID=A0A9N9H0D8_9GLOM|nr:3921_t:CDS:2 [Dentiscutata erythropus]